MSERSASPLQPMEETIEPPSLPKYSKRERTPRQSRGTLQALAARIDAQDEAIRRLGAAFATLSTLQDHCSRVPRVAFEEPLFVAQPPHEEHAHYKGGHQPRRGGRGGFRGNGGYRDQRGHAPGFRSV